MSNLDHKSNLLTTIAFIIGGISLTDAVTFIVGLVVLVLAAVNNYYSIKKNRIAAQNELNKKKYYENEKQNS